MKNKLFIRLANYIANYLFKKRDNDISSYLITLDYGGRVDDKELIITMLRQYSNDISKVVLIINNNPYNLEFFLYIEIPKGRKKLEQGLLSIFNSKRIQKSNRIYNIEEDLMAKGYRGVVTKYEKAIEVILIPEANEIFEFPDRKTINIIWPCELRSNNFTVYLCYSGKDKKLVEKIYDVLQQNNIHCWFSDYEIDYGDSIVDKINEGLLKCDIGVVCLSKNYFNSTTNLPIYEKNFFLGYKMRNKKKDIIFLNLEESEDYIPIDFNPGDQPLLSYNDELNKLIDFLRERINTVLQ